MATSKQDRTYARTATDLERKYNFGKSFGEVYGLIDEAKRIAKEAEDAVNNLDTELDQEEVFNRLTNNGQAQGIYRTEDGDIYINGKYVEFDGAVIGGWDISDEGGLKKDVTTSDGAEYRVLLQPPHETYGGQTWILSCQQKVDGQYQAKFILLGDGTAIFGSTWIYPDGTIVAGNTQIYPDSRGLVTENLTVGNISFKTADSSEPVTAAIHIGDTSLYFVNGLLTNYYQG